MSKPQMHEAVCAKCGERCEVPFKPSPSKPVYCSRCFQKTDPKRPTNINEELNQINDKLDRILRALHLD
jgi:CxxC-x17-CxxC domain-containing protein